MAKRLTQQELLNRFKERWGTRYDYSLVDYVNKRTKVLIGCKTHGFFLMFPLSHSDGHGCPKCGNESQAKKMSKPKYDFKKFLEKARRVHGNKFVYSEPGTYEGVKQKINIHCTICGNNFKQMAGTHLSGSGCPKCKAIQSGIRSKNKPLQMLRKKVCGVGIYDTDEVCVNEKSFKIWREMIKRCYDIKIQAKRPTYMGCKVCPEWMFYSNYKKWYKSNYIKDFEVDKDLLSNSDNIIYSPKTCVFLPPEINSCLVKKHNNRYELPTGIYKNGSSYIASCNRVYLGSYKELDDALDAYVKEKKRKLVELANKWKEVLDERAYNALMNLDVQKYYRLIKN